MVVEANNTFEQQTWYADSGNKSHQGSMAWSLWSSCRIYTRVFVFFPANKRLARKV
jgi:hypothetical protein